LLRVLPVHKCFDKDVLRARRARELTEKELREFHQSLPSKEAIKAQEAAAFRAGLNILRSAKAKKSGNYVRTLNPRAKSGKLCIRFSAHNLPKVPDSSKKEMMSSFMDGIIKVQKSGLALGFSKMVQRQHDSEASPPQQNPSHNTSSIGVQKVLDVMALGTRAPTVMAKLYQRSSRPNLKNYWYLVGQTGPMTGASPDFNIYFNFINRSGEDPMFRLRLYDWQNEQATHVLGSIDFETNTMQEAVEDFIEERLRKLQGLKKEAEALGQAVSAHVGEDRLRRLKDRWVQLMFTVDYPEAPEMATKLEELRTRISLHCKCMGPNDHHGGDSSHNIEAAYEVHAGGCQYEPTSKKTKGAPVVDGSQDTQLYFEQTEAGFALKYRGVEFTRPLINYYKGKKLQ